MTNHTTETPLPPVNAKVIGYTYKCSCDRKPMRGPWPERFQAHQAKDNHAKRNYGQTGCRKEKQTVVEVLEA